MKIYVSDNNSGVHPKIMEKILEESKKHALPYGKDETTKKAKEMIIQLLNKEADISFVTTGTAANIIGLSGLLKPYEAVVAPDTAHINVDESSALERFSGSKIITVPNVDGKIRIEDIAKTLERVGQIHAAQPRVISISQVTETGTIYEVEEIKKIADFAHDNNMLLHLDGARIANALEVLDVTLEEMISDTGVDLFSFGGAKNGMMIGEAIVSFNKEFAPAYTYGVKQGMQLVSKMRFISAQFVGYLEDDLWLKNAKNANEMGRYLAKGIEEIPEATLVDYNNTNSLFIKFPTPIIKRLKEKLEFYILDINEKEGLIRLMTSYDNEKEDIDKLIEIIKEAI